MSRPLTEKEKAFINSLATATEKDLMEWTENIGKTNNKKLSDIIKYLQEQHGLKYKMAHTLTHLYLENKDKNTPTIGYASEGRGGKVIYKSPEAHFELDWEFGCGNSVAIIYIPTTEQWEAQTHTKLSERQTILDFIGAQAVSDQTHDNGSYIIHYNTISIMGG